MVVKKEELDIRKDALKDTKAAYRLLQAFKRLSEIGDRTDQEEKKLNGIRRNVWSLKKSIAKKNGDDLHPFVSNPEEIEEDLY
jgi:hypothetical protein